MPPLEIRRLAVAAALRAVADEPLGPRPVTNDLVEHKVETLEGQMATVLRRLDSVETALLESVWDRSDQSAPATPAPVLPPAGVVPVEADEEIERISVPAVPMGGGRMSSVAAKALFGG